jgi:tetratricopeptide (TPR) repeat protein
VVHKRGIVLMTNGDRGDLMTNKLCSISAGLDLSTYYKGAVFSQYPSIACELFQVYNDKNEAEMFVRLSELIQATGKDIGESVLNELAFIFREKDTSIAKKFVLENIKLYPDEPIAFWILGKLYIGENEYKLAYENLTKAKDLNFYDKAWINSDIEKCKKKLNN